MSSSVVTIKDAKQSKRLKQALHKLRGWQFLLLAILLLVPILMMFSFLDYSQFSVIFYARLGLLEQAGFNSLIHLLLTLLGTAIMGTTLAWLTSICRFPAMESFWWVWLLPMALPTFAIASAYEQAGFFAEINTIGRMAIYSTLSLYPLVFLIMRIAFATQNGEYLEGSRCLGTSVFSGLFRVGLSMNRPAFVAALLIVAMEVLSDLATPELLDFKSLAKTTFQAAQDELVRSLAIELTCLLLLIFLVILWLENRSRGDKQYHQIISGFRKSERIEISSLNKVFAIIFSLVAITISLLLPLMILVTVPPDVEQTPLIELWQSASTSITLATTSGILVVLIGLVIGFGVRYHPSIVMSFASSLPSLSLIVPGSILALMVIAPLQLVDNFLSQMMSLIYQRPIENIVESTLIPTVYLLVIKFLALGTFAIRATIELTSETMDQASRSLGCGTMTTFFRIHLPYLLPTLLAVFFLVFVETLRESAIVLILTSEHSQSLTSHALESIMNQGVLASSREVVLLVTLALLPALLLTTIVNLKKI